MYINMSLFLEESRLLMEVGKGRIHGLCVDTFVWTFNNIVWVKIFHACSFDAWAVQRTFSQCWVLFFNILVIFLYIIYCIFLKQSCSFWSFVLLLSLICLILAACQYYFSLFCSCFILFDNLLFQKVPLFRQRIDYLIFLIHSRHIIQYQFIIILQF